MGIKVDKVSKRFGSKWVLRDVSFEVSEGEVFGIFGPAGSGKTSLLRIVKGLDSSHTGAVTTGSTSGNVTLCPEPPSQGLLGGVFNRSTSTDSTGEFAFTSLMRALESSSGPVLLDNILASMDDRMREDAVTEIRKVAAERRLPVVLATSKFNDILLACDRVAVLNGTELRQEGTPREVYEEPRTIDVAALVGRNNLIEARRISSSKKDEPEFQSIIGEHRLTARRTERSSLGAINRNIHLAIRPEQIAISFGASFPEDNLLKAKITGIRFNGQTTSLELDADGLKLEGLVPRLVGLHVGDECMVSLPPDRIIVLKD